MKKDLDYIFRKVRNIKARIGAQYPQAAMKAEQKVKANSLCEDGQEFDGGCSMAVDAAHIANASTSGHRHIKPLAKSMERKSSRDAVTVDYIQMDRKIDVEPGIAANDTDNESSDTSDTWWRMSNIRQAINLNAVNEWKTTKYEATKSSRVLFLLFFYFVRNNIYIYKYKDLTYSSFDSHHLILEFKKKNDYLLFVCTYMGGGGVSLCRLWWKCVLATNSVSWFLGVL